MLIKRHLVKTIRLFANKSVCYCSLVPSTTSSKIACAGRAAGGTPSIHPSPFYVKAELNQVSFCQSLCLCMVLWKIICVDESQWEIVLITTPKDGSAVVFVFLMRRSISDDGQVIDEVKCFVSYVGQSRQQREPFFG